MPLYRCDSAKMGYPRSEILNKSETCRGYKSLKIKLLWKILEKK